jgi:hypothetical protein
MDHVSEVVGDISVIGALCFVDGDWPLLGGAFVSRGVHVGWQKRIIKLLVDAEPGGVDVAQTRDVIAARFTPA